VLKLKTSGVFIKAHNWTQNKMQNLKKKMLAKFLPSKTKGEYSSCFLRTQFLGLGAVFASFFLQF
jgi:hypothetical protein